MQAKLKDIEVPVGIILQATSGYCNYPIGLSDISENDDNFIQYNIARDFNVVSGNDINIYRTIDISKIGNSTIEILDNTITKTGYERCYNPIVANTELTSTIEPDISVVYKNVEDLSNKSISVSFCTKSTDINNTIFSDSTTTFRSLFGYITIDFEKSFLFVSIIDDLIISELVNYDTITETKYFYIKPNRIFIFDTHTKNECVFENYDDTSISTTNFVVSEDDYLTTLSIVENENDIIYNTEIEHSLNPINVELSGSRYVVNYNSDYIRYFDNFENVKSDFEDLGYYIRIDKNINILNMYKEGKRYLSVAGFVLGKMLSKLNIENVILSDINMNVDLLFDLTSVDKIYCIDRDYNFCFYVVGIGSVIHTNNIVSEYINLTNFMNNITIYQIYMFFEEFINNNKKVKNDLYIYDKFKNVTIKYIDGLNNIEDVEFDIQPDKMVVLIKLYGILEKVSINITTDNIIEII